MMMHVSRTLLAMVLAAVATTSRTVMLVTAFVPTHVEYFTDTELDALAVAASAHQHEYEYDGGAPHDAGAVVAGLRRGRDLGILKSEDEEYDSNVVEAADVLVGGDEDGAIPDEVSPETEELFAAAAAGDAAGSADDMVDDAGLTFDPPILFGQYSSDTCEEDALLYSGSIEGITMLEDGVFCIHDTFDGNDMYTRLTNENCTVFGVVDSYVGCADSACEDCSDDDDDYYLGLTTWDQVFPQEFDQHCFQQEFATYENATGSYSMETTFNIDYSFASESSAAALDYKKYIAVHSCIADFVSSDAVTFTSESVTVTDAATGDSVTVTEDSVTTTDADGSSMEIIGTDDATLDVVFTGPEGQSMTVDNATVIMTDDGGTIVENEDQFVATTSDGNWVIVEDDSITYGNAAAYLFVTTDGTNFVQFGSTVGLGEVNVTTDGLEVDVSDTGLVTLVVPENSFTFGEDYVTMGGAVNITEVEYNFTNNLNDYFVPAGAENAASLEDVPFFIIMGTIDGVCDTVFIAIGADASISGSPDCGILAIETDDGVLIVSDDIVYEATDEGTLVLTDDELTITDADGNTVVAADVTSNPDDDDSLIIANEDFYFASSAAAGGAIFMTDGMIAVGTEDAFMLFQDDAVTFGSLTQNFVGNVPIYDMGSSSNFTLPADVEIDAEMGAIIVALDDGTNDGTMTFTNEGTVILEGSDGTLTINDVTYNYTQDAFVIMGDLEFGMGCDIFIAFNLEGFVAGSEECDFLFGAEAGADADDDFVNDVLIGVDADADTDDDGATDDAAMMMDDDGSDDGDDGLTAPCTTLGKYLYAN